MQDVVLVLPIVSVYGTLELNKSTLVFEGTRVSDRDAELYCRKELIQFLKRRIWGVRIINRIFRRRYLLERPALEIFFVDGTSCLLHCDESEQIELIFQFLLEQKPPCLQEKRLWRPEALIEQKDWTMKWIHREITNFEYLMLLNSAAGRTYNDLTQYPVFPWILNEYEAKTLNLDDASVYRDLSKPMGALDPSREAELKERFELLQTEQSEIPPFHFPTHFSNLKSVLYYLIRVAPYTTYAERLEMDKEVFRSIGETFQQCRNDSRELIPEFFCFPEFLRNLNQLEGMEDVVLPPWAATPEDFIRIHRLALESEHVSAQLHHWIDLIFGSKQKGTEAVEACNVFYYLAYDELIDGNKVTDLNIELEINRFGQVPAQLFTRPHPSRMTKDQALEYLYPQAHGIAALSSKRQVRRQDVATHHDMAISSINFVPDLSVAYSIDESGHVGSLKYLSTTPDSRGFPFTVTLQDQSWHLPPGCDPSSTTIYYELLISSGHWDGSWRITFAADGEPVQRVVFHKKPIRCMDASEDITTGDLAVAFGSDDGTVSVWALSKFSATRSRRMFSRQDLPVSAVPWALLTGHTNPVTCVALNVELDLVISGSTQSTVLIHTLRTGEQIHAFRLPALDVDAVELVWMEVSCNGDVVVHAIANGISTLYLVSMNGQLMAQHSIDGEVKNATRLLDKIIFSKCGNYLVTASAGRNGGIDVRYVNTLQVHRRIESKPSSHLTAIAVSPDERCVLAGFEDGSIMSYGLHFGLAVFDDENKNAQVKAQARAAAAASSVPSKITLHVKQGDPWPSQETMCVLVELHDQLRTPCIANEVQYEQLLTRLWKAVYPMHDFERTGTKWTQMGFQRPDPTTDFRAGGILSLNCLVYFAESYPDDMRALVQSQIPGSHKNTYPLGPSAINVTCRLAQLFWTAQGQVVATRRNVWPILSQPQAFLKLFAEAIRIFDFMWNEMKAEYSTFSYVIQSTEQEMETILNLRASTIEELLEKAVQRRRAYCERNGKEFAETSELVSIMDETPALIDPFAGNDLSSTTNTVKGVDDPFAGLFD